MSNGIEIKNLPSATTIKQNDTMTIVQDKQNKQLALDVFANESDLPTLSPLENRCDEVKAKIEVDEYSAEITTSQAMSKIGSDDSGVNLHENVLDGAYESCVLKGKTMVNCIQEPSSKDVVLPYEFADGHCVTINDTKESGALGVELKGQTLVNLVPKKIIDYTASSDWDGYCCLVQNSKQSFDQWRTLQDLKPNTKYYISCYVETFEDANNKDYCLNNPSAESIFEDSMIINGVGRYQWLSTTKSELTDEIFIVLRSQNAHARGAIKIRDIMIIEYQEGMENWNIPYFEGMTSCKVPILHTVGKNLFDMNRPCDAITDSQATVVQDTNQITVSSAESGTYVSANFMLDKDFFAGKTVTGSCLYESDEKDIGTVQIVYQDGNGEHHYQWIRTPRTFTFPNNFIGDVMLCVSANNTGTPQSNTVTVKNIQLELGSTATSYEPHKSSILSTPSDLILRGIGDVRDELDLMTGEIVSNFATYTFNGSENFSDNKTSDSHVCFGFHVDNIPTLDSSKSIGLSKDIPYQNWSGAYPDKELIYVKWAMVYVSVSKDKLVSHDVNGLKMFLKEKHETGNPISFIYPLHEKLIKTVDLKVVDQNGSVIPTLKSWNTTTHIYSEIPENSLYPILSHSNPTYPVILKPSTKYSIVANSYSNNHTNSAINFNLGGATASTTVGNRVTTITTPSTLTSEELVMSGRGNKLNNVMVIEGDVAGDEPYFEGMCDSKSPILSNVGKNLFDYKNYGKQDINIVEIENGLRVSTWATSLPFINNLLPNTKYTSKSVVKVVEEQVGATDIGAGKIYIYNGTNYFLLFKADGGKYVFTTPSDIKSYNRILFYAHGGGGSKVGVVDITNIQLEETSSATTYEPYKSNTTTFEQKDDKTIVLRSLPDGTCDTLNVETGEYVQKIGERNYQDGDTNSNTLVTDGTKTHYKLSSPIITTIDVQGFPHAYKNGHIQLSSGSTEPSLTPTVTYKVPVSRVGQIASNTKSNLRQTIKLDQLEILAYQSLINAEYENLLVQNSAESAASFTNLSTNDPKDELYYMLKHLIEEDQPVQNMLDKINLFYLYGLLSDEHYFDLLLGGEEDVY